MGMNDELTYHQMELVGIGGVDQGDIEFKLWCTSCGYETSVRLLDMLTSPDLSLYHAPEEDAEPSLAILLERPRVDLPPCIEDFLKTLGNSD